MDIFYLTLKQMLMMFTLILVGFILRKKSVLPENSGTVMAKMETNIFVPALSLYTMFTKCNIESLKSNSVLVLYGLVIILCAVLLSFPLSALFVRNASSPKEAYKRCIYRYSMTFSNYGFMGNFIILGIWGEGMYYKYSMFNFVLGILCSSWGLYMLIPKEHNKGLWDNLKKGLLAPPIIALISGMIIGASGLANYVPDFIITALKNASSCQGPVAMVLAGFVIGGYDIKGLLFNRKVYVASFMRLVVIPAAILMVLRTVGVSEEIMTLALVAYATPLGLNTIVYPAAYGGETETGASMAMISHTLSVVTIPLMYLIFIVLL